MVWVWPMVWRYGLMAWVKGIGSIHGIKAWVGGICLRHGFRPWDKGMGQRHRSKAWDKGMGLDHGLDWSKNCFLCPFLGYISQKQIFLIFFPLINYVPQINMKRKYFLLWKGRCMCWQINTKIWEKHFSYSSTHTHTHTHTHKISN